MERYSRLREEKELRECTFSPDIGENSRIQTEDIVTKTKKWQYEKERRMVEYERLKMHRELSECTFSPNNAKEKYKNAKINPDEFYKRNIEWKAKKEVELKSKQDELYSTIMSGGDRSRNTSVNFSRMNDSRTEKSPTVRTFQKSNSRPSLITLQAPLSTIRHKEPKSSTSRMNDSTLSKGPIRDPKLQHQISESYALLDGLQQLINSKKDTSGRKMDFDDRSQKSTITANTDKDTASRLKTDPSVPKVIEFHKPVQKSPRINFQANKEKNLSKQPSNKSMPTKPSSPKNKNKTTTEGYDEEFLVRNLSKLVVKNNRYVIEDHSTSISIDESNKSPVKHPNYTKRESLGVAKKGENNAELSAKYANGKGNSGSRQSLTNGLTSPTSQNLEKKYMDLLGQVNRVTKQISKIKNENANLKNDIESLQKNQMMNSLYT